MIRETNSREKSGLLKIISNTFRHAGMGHVEANRRGIFGKSQPQYSPHHPHYADLNPMRMAEQSFVGRINRETMLDVRLVDGGVAYSQELATDSRNIAAILLAEPHKFSGVVVAGGEPHFYTNSVSIGNMTGIAYLIGRIVNSRYSIGVAVEEIYDNGGVNVNGSVRDEESRRNEWSMQLMIVRVGDTFFFGDGGAERRVRVYERQVYEDVSVGASGKLLEALPKRLQSISRQDVIS